MSTLPEITQQKALPLSQKKILLAEDNQINQIIATKFLEKMGLSTDTAENGIEVLELVSKKAYDLIIMDCQMPLMDGLEATAKIRNGFSGITNPHVPIIAMTAESLEKYREQCLSHGMNDYLSKPIQYSSFLEIISKWLSITDCTLKKINPTPQSKDAKPSGNSLSKLAFPTSEIFDQKNFLERTMHDTEIAKKLITCFTRDLQQQLLKLQEAFATDDIQQASFLAHRIQGAAGNMGGVTVQQLASSIESFCKSGEFARAAALLHSLKEHCSLLLQALHSL